MSITSYQQYEKQSISQDGIEDRSRQIEYYIAEYYMESIQSIYHYQRKKVGIN